MFYYIKKCFKLVYRQIYNWFRLKISQIGWVLKNRHNKTRMGNYFPKELVSVGKWTYGRLNVHHFECEEEGLQIGHFCSIGPDVEFFLGGEHHPKYISNYPFALYMPQCKQYEKYDRTTKGRIIVDDDVWIGAGTIILSGVHIGQGAIIGAGSVVAKDVPPYAIFANGKIQKYRFSSEIIKELLQLDYERLSCQEIIENIDDFYTDRVEEVIKNKWWQK